ncbi:hypothetical protein [Lactobacillus terrae]|uniref:hypothetical protein n=1 Tax=Lactobacillus terrae TaxID=2269374 RepID=UPI000C1B6977|nr:hypothetical protein [Lactobacillus terrae]
MKSEEFLTKGVIVFACYNCDHPAMVIDSRDEVATNGDGSTKYEIKMHCPRCKSTDSFILNDGSAENHSESVNAKKVPNLDKAL